MLSINHNGRSYNFSRSKGKGLWLRNNIIAPLSLQQELSSLARKEGLVEEHNFVLYTPKPEPRKAVHVGKTTKRNKATKRRKGPKRSKTAVRLKVRLRT